MNKDIIKGKWNEIKGKTKSAWGKLTDDDLDRISGDYEALVGTIQKRYGYEKDRAQTEVNRFFERL